MLQSLYNLFTHKNTFFYVMHIELRTTKLSYQNNIMIVNLLWYVCYMITFAEFKLNKMFLLRVLYDIVQFSRNSDAIGKLKTRENIILLFPTPTKNPKYFCLFFFPRFYIKITSDNNFTHVKQNPQKQIMSNINYRFRTYCGKSTDRNDKYIGR